MSHEGSVIAGRGWERPEMVGRTGQERKGSVRQYRARRDRVEQGRTQDFLKGPEFFFSCIMASRVRTNQLYVSYSPCCHAPQSSHITKILKKRLKRCKSRNLAEETLKI